MAGPALLTAGAVTGLASIGTQAAGIFQARDAADAQAAQLSRQEALAKKDVAREARLAIGRAEAQFGASGLDVGSASVLDVLAGLELQEMENFNRLSVEFDNRRAEVKAQKQAATLSGVGNILGTAGSTAFALAAPKIE